MSRRDDPLPATLEVQTPRRASSPGKRVAMLVVVQGSDADLGAHARVEGEVVVGRDPLAQLRLTDAGASKRHAAVTEVSGWRGKVSWRVKDLGSRNGTLLNGKPVKGAKELKDADKLELGGTTLKFSVVDELDAAFQAQVDALLSTDDLTGLWAQRRFDAALEEAVRGAEQAKVKLALLVLDMDGLKAINDRHGHAMGAWTIAQVGRLLARTVASRGLASRFGGDEFVASLPGHDRPAALAVGEAVRRAVAAHDFTKDHITVSPTISIGVAVFPDDGATTRSLFDAADRALYRAKALGKDRVASR